MEIHSASKTITNANETAQRDSLTDMNLAQNRRKKNTQGQRGSGKAGPWDTARSTWQDSISGNQFVNKGQEPWA